MKSTAMSQDLELFPACCEAGLQLQTETPLKSAALKPWPQLTELLRSGWITKPLT